MFPMLTPEQMRLLAEAHRNDLIMFYGGRGPSRVRPLLVSVLRRIANRLDRPAARAIRRGEPIRVVLRLPTSALGDDRT